MKKNGRPEKINAKIIDAIVSAIKAGNYMEASAAYAGISKDTLYRWLKTGTRLLDEMDSEEGKRKYKPKPKDLPYILLARGIRKATADAEVRDVSMISKAAAGGVEVSETTEVYDAAGNLTSKIVKTKTVPPQWQAAAWRLERKYSKRWGRRLTVKKDEGKEPDDTPEAYADRIRSELGGMIGFLGCGELGEPDDKPDPSE